MPRRVYLPVIGVVAFIVLALANLPLSLALSLADARGRGLDWAGTQGTIWHGTIGAARWQGHPIGRVEQRTGFMPLVAGRLSSRMTVTGAAANGEGRIILSGARVRLEEAAMLVDLGAYNILDAFAQPMRGMLRLETDRLVIGQNGCREGEFFIWTDTLAYSAQHYGGQGFPIEGDAVCPGDGSAVLTLAGSGNGRAVTIEAALDPSLDWFADVRVTGADGQMAEALQLFGFEPRANGLNLIQRGTLLPES